MEDRDLLQAYVKSRSDAAFDELMRRHVDLVYTAARRRTADAHLAEDVTQAVFIVLARKAASLRSDVILPAWLLHVTRLTASNAVRTRINQARIERKAASMNSENSAQRAVGESQESPEMAGVAPLLDDAIAGLPESDRNALVLRYFSHCSMAEVAQSLGVTAVAAEKRVSRATDRLRQSLVRGGAALSLLALAEVLTDSSVAAAPAEIAAKLNGAIATAAAGVKITPSVELANHTIKALNGNAGKSVFSGTTGLAAASFVCGVLLAYFVLSYRSAPPAPAPVVVAVAPVLPEANLAPVIVETANMPVSETSIRMTEQPQKKMMPTLRAVFAPPEELAAAAGPRIDLLKRVDLPADSLNGEWTQNQNVLQSGMTAYSILQLPYVPPEEYDYHATFTVLQIRGEVVMHCSHKGADFGWQMGARENRTTAFDVSPSFTQNNPGRRDTEAVFVAGVPYHATVQVRNNGVAAYINGKLVGRFETNYEGLSAFHYWQMQNRAALGIGAWGTPTRFESLEVVEVTGHGKWLREEGKPAVAQVRPTLTDAALWEKAVDLLPMIDPERDAVSGKWQRNKDGELVAAKGSLARLEIPYNPPEEYDFKMVFTRSYGWDTIGQIVRLGRSNLMWGMGMWGNEVNMFRCVGEFEGTNPLSAWAKEFFENGRRFESVVQVRKQSCAAFIDGKLVSFYDRGFNGAHLTKEWKMPTPGLLGIACNNDELTIHALQVLEITGTGTAATPAKAKRMEPAPAADADAEAPRNPATVKPPKAPQDPF